MPDINITGYDNEDIIRVFTLKTGTVDSSVVIDITTYDFEIDVVDRATCAVIFRMTTAESDHRIVKNDPTNGQFTLTIAKGLIPFVDDRKLIYDLVRRDGSGILTRLWGGRITIKNGVTAT